ncbi:hypothetical protein EDB19DRAFT_1824635 [Suillus lakei]|nr:hypothetical protein EDB19DRAFT_1824635 [Suillus lakei]
MKGHTNLIVGQKVSFFDDSGKVSCAYVAVVAASEEELSICRKGRRAHIDIGFMVEGEFECACEDALIGRETSDSYTKQLSADILWGMILGCELPIMKFTFLQKFERCKVLRTPAHEFLIAYFTTELDGRSFETSLIIDRCPAQPQPHPRYIRRAVYVTNRITIPPFGVWSVLKPVAEGVFGSYKVLSTIKETRSMNLAQFAQPIEDIHERGTRLGMMSSCDSRDDEEVVRGWYCQHSPDNMRSREFCSLVDLGRRCGYVYLWFYSLLQSENEAISVMSRLWYERIELLIRLALVEKKINAYETDEKTGIMFATWRGLDVDGLGLRTYKYMSPDAKEIRPHPKGVGLTNDGTREI